MSFISNTIGQYTYFDRQLGRPHWRGKKVLDFGGNAGDILKGPHCAIYERCYWCIDVSRDAIEQGRRMYPQGHWFFYNRYNAFFNPDGVAGLEVPDVGEQFDYILAYSVFTHIVKDEMLDLIDCLKRRLSDTGVLAFTFIDAHYVYRPGVNSDTSLKWRLECRKKVNPEVDIRAIMEKSGNASRLTVADDLYVYADCDPPEDDGARGQKCFDTYYTAEFMATLFPDARILPPIDSGHQYCCIISEREAMESGCQ
jgi:hypothetical protein